MKYTIPQNHVICKFMNELKLDTLFGKVAYKHIHEFLSAASLKGYRGKMTDIADCSLNHRTTIAHFFNNGKWNEAVLETAIKTHVIKTVFEKQAFEQTPIFISIDDTINNKKKPSSKAKAPMQGTDFHYSHLAGKTVWGHQVMATMMSCGDIALNYDVQLCHKEQSKIDYMIELAKTLPIPTTKSYMLCDSWFTSSKMIDAFEQQGYFCIGALRTNRIIYPQGIRMQISDFADKHIHKQAVDLVTVNGQDYEVYRYEGPLKDVPNAVVLISYPVGHFKDSKKLKAFICTDVSLDTQTILNYYTNRWCIETFFKQQKSHLGFNKYQIRSLQGIKRFWILAAFAHLFYTTGWGVAMPFGAGRCAIQKELDGDLIAYIYKSALNNVPCSDLIKELVA